MPIRKILIVENEALIAFGYKTLLEEKGYEICGTARSVADALEMIEVVDMDAAMLDVDLKGQESEPVAAALAHLGVPFCVITGTLRSMIEGPNLLTAPTIAKMASDAEVLAALEALEAG